MRELARRSSLPPEAISRSERGVTEISLTSLEKVCAGLGMSVQSFFEFTSATPELPLQPPEAHRAAQMLADAPPAARRRAMRVLEALLGEENGIEEAMAPGQRPKRRRTGASQRR